MKVIKLYSAFYNEILNKYQVLAMVRINGRYEYRRIFFDSEKDFKDATEGSSYDKEEEVFFKG